MTDRETIKQAEADAQNADAFLVGMGQVLDEGITQIAEIKRNVTGPPRRLASDVEACLLLARRIVDGMDTPVIGQDLQATADAAAEAGRRLKKQMGEL